MNNEKNSMAIKHAKASVPNAASDDTTKSIHLNEKHVQQKHTGAVEPNNPKAENRNADQIDEKDLPPFQAGKPII